MSSNFKRGKPNSLNQLLSYAFLSPCYSIISPVLKWANYFVIGATEPPARAGLSPVRTTLVDGIQLDKEPVQPRDVTTGRAVGQGHLVPFPGYTLSSNPRSAPDPLLPLPSPLPSSLHSPTDLFLPFTQTPIFSHLLQLFQSLQYLNTFSPFTRQFFFHPPSLFSPFPYWFSLFSTQSTLEKIFLLLNRICEMCCAYSSLALTTPRLA